MGAAPRIFEKAHARIEGMVAEEGGLKKRIFDWAIAVGLKVSRARQAGAKPSLPLSLQAQGSGQAGVLHHPRAVRWSAPVLRLRGRGPGPRRRAVVRRRGHHRARGLRTDRDRGRIVHQPPDAYRFGTVGRTFPDTEVKIADDGEILLKSPV